MAASAAARAAGWEAGPTENLIFSLNATVPVFLLMVLGYFLHQCKVLDDGFAAKLNRFVFQLALPVQLFESLSTEDFHAVWDGQVVAFCLVATVLSILLMGALSLLGKASLRAEFIQGGYRSSQALLGGALMQNIYGQSGGPLALILIGSVPLYNVAAVVLLALLAPGGGHLDRQTLKKTARGVVTNPILVSIALGMVWSLVKLPQPVVFQRALSSLGATATPLGLLALGASIDLKRALKLWKPTTVCTLCKLGLFAAIFLPVAVWMGCRDEILVAILVMLASPTAVSSFTMARSMGHEGTLTSGVVVMTTVCSAFSFTCWLYLLRTLSLI